MNPKTIVHSLAHTRLGKIALVFIIVGLTASASAAVFEMYYGTATATVQNPDIVLVKGSDVSSTCNVYPCATATLSSTKDSATLGISLFKSATNTPQPATYYTNLLEINNSGTSSHTINSVSVTGVTQTGTDFGSISVYLCATSLDVSVSTNAATCAQVTFTTTAGGSLSSGSTVTFPYTLTAGSTAYIEVAGYANPNAAVSDTIQFHIGISWT